MIKSLYDSRKGSELNEVEKMTLETLHKSKETEVALIDAELTFLTEKSQTAAEEDLKEKSISVLTDVTKQLNDAKLKLESLKEERNRVKESSDSQLSHLSERLETLPEPPIPDELSHSLLTKKSNLVFGPQSSSLITSNKVHLAEFESSIKRSFGHSSFADASELLAGL